MSETTSGQLPNLLPFHGRAAAASPAIGRTSLYDIDRSAVHFYSADEHYIGRTPTGEHRVIVVSATGEHTVPEEVGSGHDVESALQDSLDRMRTLETVHTRSLAQIEMTKDASVSFTPLERYTPKVAPSHDTYPIPAYLEATLADDENGRHTYNNTVTHEGWQTEVRTILADYLRDDPAGQQLMGSLKIRSLSHLTPEQAVKLSASFVQNVSKYSYEDTESQSATRADRSTTMQLLKEGIANKDNPDWKGNGVCRNVASNVKIVFESLKATQSKLSMLNNTYAVYGGGSAGAGYRDSRANGFKTEVGGIGGHAWNTFVTLDAKGSAVATITDATWALGRDAESAIAHLDQTEVRAAAQLMKLYEQSEVKAEAFGGLTDYVRKLLNSTAVNRQLSADAREGIREYITTEYLKAATMLPEMPEYYMLPDTVVSSAYRMRSRLEPREVQALFALDKASGGFEREHIKAIITDYDTRREVRLPEWKSAENLLFADRDLQALAFEAVGDARITQLAEASGALRAKVRQERPELLPPFDARQNRADASELNYLVSMSGIQERDPRMLMNRLRTALKKAAGNEHLYAAIVTGRSDYDLAKNFTAIFSALKKVQQ